MSDKDKLQQEDGIWPPTPSLPPPMKLAPKPLVVRISVWLVVLIDFGVSSLLVGLAFLRLSMGHNTIHWADTVAEGLIPGILLFGVHLWVRHFFSKRSED